MNKKVIITGTKGFIGSNLREELDSGYQIVEINEDILDLPDWTEKIQDFFKLTNYHSQHQAPCTSLRTFSSI